MPDIDKDPELTESLAEYLRTFSRPGIRPDWPDVLPPHKDDWRTHARRLQAFLRSRGLVIGRITLNDPGYTAEL